MKFRWLIVGYVRGSFWDLKLCDVHLEFELITKKFVIENLTIEIKFLFPFKLSGELENQ